LPEHFLAWKLLDDGRETAIAQYCHGQNVTSRCALAHDRPNWQPGRSSR
jgi:hypothetical protein